MTPKFFLHNFNTVKSSFVFFDINHPDVSV